MPTRHIVKQGETMSSIAAQHKFGDFKPIFSHPANADLRKKRKDPHILLPGDVVIIPEPRPKTVTKAAGTTNKFVAASTQLRLELRLQDPFSKPIAGKSCELRTDLLGADDGKPSGSVLTDSIKTDDKGRTRVDIAPTVVDAELRVFESPPGPSPLPPPPTIEKYDLIVGGLDPVKEPSGLRGRLNNLGYFAGLTDAPEDREQLFWAIEEFQFDNDIKPQNGNFDDPDNPMMFRTRQKLVEVHGDKEPV